MWSRWSLLGLGQYWKEAVTQCALTHYCLLWVAFHLNKRPHDVFEKLQPLYISLGVATPEQKLWLVYKHERVKRVTFRARMICMSLQFLISTYPKTPLHKKIDIPDISFENEECRSYPEITKGTRFKCLMESWMPPIGTISILSLTGYFRYSMMMARVVKIWQDLEFLNYFSGTTTWFLCAVSVYGDDSWYFMKGIIEYIWNT